MNTILKTSRKPSDSAFSPWSIYIESCKPQALTFFPPPSLRRFSKSLVFSLAHFTGFNLFRVNLSFLALFPRRYLDVSLLKSHVETVCSHLRRYLEWQRLGKPKPPSPHCCLSLPLFNTAAVVFNGVWVSCVPGLS